MIYIKNEQIYYNIILQSNITGKIIIYINFPCKFENKFCTRWDLIEFLLNEYLKYKKIDKMWLNYNQSNDK